MKALQANCKTYRGKISELESALAEEKSKASFRAKLFQEKI